MLYDDVLKARRDRIERYVSGVNDPLKTTTPFPQIFASTVNQEGFLKTKRNTKSSKLTKFTFAIGLYTFF